MFDKKGKPITGLSLLLVFILTPTSTPFPPHTCCCLSLNEWNSWTTTTHRNARSVCRPPYCALSTVCHDDRPKGKGRKSFAFTPTLPLNIFTFTRALTPREDSSRIPTPSRLIIIKENEYIPRVAAVVAFLDTLEETRVQ